jgi:hypothetical protein
VPPATTSGLAFDRAAGHATDFKFPAVLDGITLCDVKSAYELAMERLSQAAPAKKLSAAQKNRIAELESLHKSKVAQHELALADELAAANAAGHPEKVENLRAQFVADKQKLEADLEAKKQAVRDEA